MSQRLKNDFILIPEIDIHTSDMSKIPEYIERLEGIKQSNLDDSDTLYKLRSSGDEQAMYDYDREWMSEMKFLDEVIQFLKTRLSRTSSPTSRSPSAPAAP